MRKTWTKVVALVLVCIMVCTLTACGTTLNGTYTLKDSVVDAGSVTFHPNNKMDISALGFELVECDYVIKDGKLIITYNLLGQNIDLPLSFERSGSDIIIEGVTFEKAK